MNIFQRAWKYVLRLFVAKPASTISPIELLPSIEPIVEQTAEQQILIAPEPEPIAAPKPKRPRRSNGSVPKQPRKPREPKPPKPEPSEDDPIPGMQPVSLKEEIKAVSKPQPLRQRRIAPKEEITPEQADHLGMYYFRDSILDQLDTYMKFIPRLRKHGDIYEFYSKIGAHIVPERTLMRIQRGDQPLKPLSPWWKINRPAFGAIAVSAQRSDFKAAMEEEKQIHKTYPRFMTFYKYQRKGLPHVVQPVFDGNVYMVAIHFDMIWDDKQPKWTKDRGLVAEFPVHITPDNEVRILRVLRTRYQNIRHKVGRSRGKEFSIPERKWEIGRFFDDWAKDNEDKRHHPTTEKFLLDVFIDLANEYEMFNSSMIQIRATKNGNTAVFSVAERRIAYFFKDRELTVSAKNKKARVFHLVRPHIRKLPSGKETYVRMHFAGLRRFEWNGYDIQISVPGLHHQNLADDFPGLVDREAIKPEKGVSFRRVGAAIAEHIFGADMDTVLGNIVTKKDMQDYLNDPKYAEQRQQDAYRRAHPLESFRATDWDMIDDEMRKNWPPQED